MALVYIWKIEISQGVNTFDYVIDVFR